MSKRQKLEADDLRVRVFATGLPDDGLDCSHLVEREVLVQALNRETEALKAREARAALQHTQRLLERMRKLLPRASDVYWDEEGGLEEIGFAQYYYGSRHNLETEFNLAYTLEFDVDLSGDWGDDRLELHYSARLSTDTGSDKVYFDLAEEDFRFSISGWLPAAAVDPTDEELSALASALKTELLAIVEDNVEEPMCSYIKEKIGDVNFVEELRKEPRPEELPLSELSQE
jgi:hypothetical protein